MLVVARIVLMTLLNQLTWFSPSGAPPPYAESWLEACLSVTPATRREGSAPANAESRSGHGIMVPGRACSALQFSDFCCPGRQTGCLRAPDFSRPDNGLLMSAPSSSLCSSGDRGPHLTGCVALTSWPRPGWLTSGSEAWVLSTWCSSLYTWQLRSRPISQESVWSNLSGGGWAPPPLLIVTKLACEMPRHRRSKMAAPSKQNDSTVECRGPSY